MATDGSYTVLARELISAPGRIASTIAESTGRIALDVTRKLRENPGILASGLSKGEADRLVGALSQAHVPALALAESEFVRFPDPVFLETARLGEDAMGVSDLRDADSKRLGSVNVPYHDIVLMATSHVRTVTAKRVVESRPNLHSLPPVIGVGAFGAAIPAPDAGERVVRRVETSHYDHFLDLFVVEPAHHLRLNTGTFNFIQTGLKMQPTSIANLTNFITHLAANCDPAAADPSIRHILDGSPHTNLKLGSPEQYDAYLSWRIQLLYHPE